jgi:hypothetical protein
MLNNRTFLAAALGVLLFAAGVPVALALTSGPAATPTPAPGVAIAQAVDPQLNALGAFRRARSDRDALPANAAAVLATHLQGVSGANPNLARVATPPNGAGTVAIVPANGMACVIVAGAGGCDEVSRLIGPPIVNSVGGDPAGSMRVSGVVPDGVDAVAIKLASGVTVNADVADNAYTIRVGAQPEDVSYDSPAGHQDYPVVATEAAFVAGSKKALAP